jgi:hypothetical protein
MCLGYIPVMSLRGCVVSQPRAKLVEHKGLLDSSGFPLIMIMTLDPMESKMKILSLKKMTIPKVAVLATGVTAALVMITVAPMTAQAKPGYTQDCTGCHGSGLSLTATPSTATPLSGATYTVKFNAAVDGYWISGTGVSAAGGSASSVSVKAPTAAGAYTYNVYARNGNGGKTTYKITVASVTPPVTTPPPTTPPVTTPPPTTPPVTTPPATSTAIITRLSDSSAKAGDRITISGSGLGQAGVVKFGTVTASVSSWSTTRISVRVPREGRSSRVSVTVTPANGTASNALSFRYHSDDHDD